MTLKNHLSEQPLVSVIIPTHNCLPFLKKALSSVLKQSYQNMEIIVIDDKSTDGTKEWLEQLSAKDSRFVAYQVYGDGVSQVRNFAISKANGDYIAFLDADDEWRPDKMSRQIAFHIANPDVVLSFTNYEHFNMRGDSLGECFAYWPHFSSLIDDNSFDFQRLDNTPIAHIFAENVIGTSSVIVRKNALQFAKGFDQELRSASDWDLWLKLSTMGSIGFSNEILMDYLVRDDSISRKTELRLQQMKKIIQRNQISVLKASPLAVLRAYARLATGWAEHYRSEGNLRAALFNHVKALVLSPNRRVARATISDAMHLSGLKR